MNMSFILKSNFFSAALLAAVPVAINENSDKELKRKTTTVSSLPLYREKEEFEYYVDPPSKTVEAVRNVRIQAEAIKDSIQPQLDKISNIYQTGKAHTKEAVFYIQDEDNKFTRLGVVATGGLIGLIATRKGSFIRRMAYASVTISGVGLLCYPEETKSLAKEGACSVMKGARIAYHFAVGARPTVGNQNGRAFEKMTNMVSDVGQYGFRLFQREPAAEKELVNVSEAKEETAPIEKISEVGGTDSNVQEVMAKESEPVQEVVESAIEVIETPVAGTPVLDTESVAKSDDASQLEEKESVDPALGQLLEGDLGQGLEEDKEMYTTRS